MLELSPLNKIWLLDVDGTIVKHNGYKIDGYDTLLDGVKEFFATLPSEDKVIFLTARTDEQVEELKKFLSANGIRYDHILSGMAMGERILVNDRKPSGLATAYAINKERDSKLTMDYAILETL